MTTEKKQKMLKEIKDKINASHYCDTILSLSWTDNDIVDKSVTFNQIENLEVDEHRWFTIETNVYEVFVNKESIGYLGIDELGVIKSELTDPDDCGIELEAFDVKPVQKLSFEIVKGEFK